MTVRTSSFYTRTKIRKLSAPTTDTGVVTATALAVLALFGGVRPIRLLGVRLELAMPEPSNIPEPPQAVVTPDQ